MATYRELLAQVKSEIDEISTIEAHERLESSDGSLFVDVREPDEWDEGHIPGAIYTGRGRLEQRIEGLVPDKSRPLVVYCSAGSRSAFAAKVLEELGYVNVVNLAGGFSDWKRNGFEVTIPRALSPEQRSRYSRHLLIPEVGEDGQQRLLDARVLLIGAGGLGSPASLYLAAAGVGTLGIVDADVVDESNLQRQIVHSTDRLGEPKVDSAKRTLEALNPDVRVVPFQERLTSENVDRILAEGWDVIVDGADNFPTRYLVNDASVWSGIPVVHGSIFRFEGQVTVFSPGVGPCYRCLFPQPPPPGARAELRRGRRARRAAGDHRLDPGERGAEADPRPRRLARRPAAPLRRARDDPRRGHRAPEPRLPGVRRPARRSPSTSTTSSSATRRCTDLMATVRIPPDAARRGRWRARARGATARTVADVIDDLVARYPAARGAAPARRRARATFVNVYVGGEDVRTRDGLDTEVRDGDQLILLPAMAGGS